MSSPDEANDMAISDTMLGTVGRLSNTNRQRAILGIVAVTTVSILLNIQIGTVTDVSWIITVIERIQAGQRLYVDIIEANPPFSIWLYYPVVSAARWVSIAPETAVAIYAYAAAFFGFGLTMFIARRGKLLSDQTQWWVWPAILSTVLILPVGAFAQREHFGLALFLPLLAVMAWRLHETDQNSVPAIVAIVAGIAGSIMILVKPHWVLAIILPAIYIAVSRRSLRSVFNVEYFVIGAIALAYLASVVAVYPDFLDKMYPMLKLLYLPIRAESSTWPALLAPFAVALSVWVLRRAREQVSALADIMAIAAVGFFLAMFILGKGWYYHRYPSLAVALIASIITLDQITRHPVGSKVYRLGCVALVIVAFVRPVYNWSNPANKLDAELVAVIQSQGANPNIATIGSDIGLGFPLVRSVDGRFASAYCSDWAGAHAVFRLTNWETSLGSEERAWLEVFLNNYINTKIDNIRLVKPGIIIEAKSGSVMDYHWIRFLHADTKFRKLMTDYEPLVENQHIAVWRRKGTELSAR
jgi:hypothetical protein